MGPAGETPTAQLVRLKGLLDRLENATHYEALGVDRKAATAADVKRSFVLLARDLHPDTVTDPAQGELRAIKERLFARVNEAAQILGDDARRKEYEKELEGDKKEVDVGRIFDAEDKFQRAEIFIKARKYKEGLQVLDEAIVLNPEEAEFYAWRGYARFLLATDRKEAFDDCAGEVKKALKMVERCVPAHLLLGHMNKVVGHLNVKFLVGDPDSKEGPRGFFKFYRDEWEEKLLGQKPTDDVMDLLEKDKDGKPISQEGYGIGGMHEYWGCLNNPNWQHVLKAWVRYGINQGVTV